MAVSREWFAKRMGFPIKISYNNKTPGSVSGVLKKSQNSQPVSAMKLCFMMS